jgi:hypothetical protein
LELRDLVDAYALAADRGDADWFRSLWLPGARLTVHDADGPARSTLDGVDVIAEVPGRLSRYVVTLHIVANHMCWADPDSHGEAATGEAYCLAHHVSAPSSNSDGDDEGEGGGDGAGEAREHDDHVMAIRYVDRYGRDGDGRWRFATREVRRQWTRHEPVRSRAGGPT